MEWNKKIELCQHKGKKQFRNNQIIQILIQTIEFFTHMKNIYSVYQNIPKCTTS